MPHCQSLRTALYRVFVQPALLNAASPRLNLHLTPSAATQCRSNSTVQWYPTGEVAGVNGDPPKKRSYKDRIADREAARSPFEKTRITPPPKIKGQPKRNPQDLEIPYGYINFVDRDDNFKPRVWRDNVLKLLDTKNEHLVQVAAADDPDDPKSLPTCRIISKAELREKIQKHQTILKEKAKADRSGKTIEMNWAIAPGDLNMKLAKICAFLEEGRKVDVMIAPKKRKRKATAEEMADLLAKLEAGVAKVEGAHHVTPPDGKVGATMTFFFEGKAGS